MGDSNVSNRASDGCSFSEVESTHSTQSYLSQTLSMHLLLLYARTTQQPSIEVDTHLLSLHVICLLCPFLGDSVVL